MARLLIQNVLLFSMLTCCLLAGKAVARPNEDSHHHKEEDVPEYANDDYNYDDNDRNNESNDDDDEAYTGPPPVITNAPLNLTLEPGATAYLPCDISVPTAFFAIIWTNNTNQLWTDSIQVNKDPRLHKFENNTIRIKNVRSEDSGDYACEISAQPVVKIVHTLHVPSPARIISMKPSKTSTTLMKGDSLMLECIVSGYPKPAITWIRKDKNKKMPSGEDSIRGISITMENVNRHHEGTYECSASNGLGLPVHQSVSIRVHYAPEINIDKESVNTAEGYESELTCTVHAEPKATVEWFYNGNIVEPSEHITITKEGGKNILRLVNTMKKDFGSYTCKAQNSIGTNEKVVKLSGMPTQPTFIKVDPPANGMIELLVWTLESSSPITEYDLKFRKDKVGEWQTTSPLVENPEGNKYTVKHSLPALDPGMYEAYIRAKNGYGWSEPSKVHQFSADQVGLNGDAAASADSSSNGGNELRPRIFALVTVLGVCAFFL